MKFYFHAPSHSYIPTQQRLALNEQKKVKKVLVIDAFPLVQWRWHHGFEKLLKRYSLLLETEERYGLLFEQVLSRGTISIT